MKESNTKIFKQLVTQVGQELGSASRGEIAENVALKSFRLNLSDERKSKVLSNLSRVGWTLNALAKNGVCFNTKSGDKCEHGAGNFKTRGEWVFNRVA